MAHFAQLDENNIVVSVLVVNNTDMVDPITEKESENIGIEYLKSLLGPSSIFKQCSYNHNFRKQYPGIGYKYDEQHDVFIANKPYSSWQLDSNFDWQAPIPKPDSDNLYMWDEINLQWKLITAPYPSWTINRESNRWEAPVSMPEDGKRYKWNEETISWIEVV